MAGSPKLSHTFTLAPLQHMLQGEVQMVFLKCRPGLACRGINNFTLLMGSRPICFTCPQACRVWPRLCLCLHLALLFAMHVPLWAHCYSFSPSFPLLPPTTVFLFPLQEMILSPPFWPWDIGSSTIWEISHHPAPPPICGQIPLFCLLRA